MEGSKQQNEINIKSNDGADIPAVIYNVEPRQTKGIVIVCHGFGESTIRYKEVAERFNKENYACIIFDQRGHGNLSQQSPEKRKKLQGVIPSYQCFLDDLTAITQKAKQDLPNVPIILYGHSMGGNIAVNYLLRHNQWDFSCAVLESPWLDLHKDKKPYPLLTSLAKKFSHIFPNIPIPKAFTKLPLSHVTSNDKKQEDFKNDSLYHNRMTLRMFSCINDGGLYALNNAPKLSIPTYIAFALRDKIVSNQAIEDFEKSCGANVTRHGYDSLHSIHNDLSRETFYQDIFAFFNTCRRDGNSTPR